jgi:hypothetical protein
MKTIKKPQNKGFTLSAKDVEKLCEKAVIKAVYLDGKWVTVFNKLEQKTYH